MKITSYTDFRVNFEVDGLHYSLTQTDDAYEDYTYLRCKETSICWEIAHRSFADVIRPFKLSSKHGSTHRQRYNINLLEEFIRQIISGIKYEDTNIRRKEIVNDCKQKIKYHQDQIKKFEAIIEKAENKNNPIGSLLQIVSN